MRVSKTKRVLRLNNPQSGVSMIEFAIVLPIVFSFLIATFDFGWVLYQTHIISQSVREGARKAATIRNVSCDGIKNAAFDETKRYLSHYGLNNELVEISPTTKDSTLSSRNLGYNVTLLHVEASMPARCIICLGLSRDHIIKEISQTRIEDPWICNTNPFSNHGI
jgi:hypothetical protein